MKIDREALQKRHDEIMREIATADIETYILPADANAWHMAAQVERACADLLTRISRWSDTQLARSIAIRLIASARVPHEDWLAVPSEVYNRLRVVTCPECGTRELSWEIRSCGGASTAPVECPYCQRMILSDSEGDSVRISSVLGSR